MDSYLELNIHFGYLPGSNGFESHKVEFLSSKISNDGDCNRTVTFFARTVIFYFYISLCRDNKCHVNLKFIAEKLIYSAETVSPLFISGFADLLRKTTFG